MSDQEIDYDWMYSMLCAALQQLSWDADRQMQWLGEIFQFMTNEPVDDMWNTDELGLEYDDAYVLVPQLIEQGYLTSQQRKLLDRIDRKLSQMSGMHNAPLWMVKALRTHPDWEELRQMAKEALSMIDCQDDPEGRPL